MDDSAFGAMKELVTVTIAPTEEIVTLLTDVKEYYRFVEIAVKQCRNGGIGT